jgi:DNA-binding NarL/FixJ family response regulator
VRGLKGKSAVILDRQPMWLAALEQILASLKIAVVGSALNGDQALELVEKHHPDLFVAGLDLTSSDQLLHVRRANEIHPTIRSVVMADVVDPATIDEAFSAGVSVYCVKTAEQEDLSSAIRQAFEQSIYLAAAGRRGAPQPAQGAARLAGHDLTRRELEVLRLVAEGYSNSQLAGMLWVTEQTVKFHLSNIYRKLSVANRTEASRWAQLHGVLPAEGGKHADPARKGGKRTRMSADRRFFGASMTRG